MKKILETTRQESHDLLKNLSEIKPDTLGKRVLRS